ncbi:43kDa postsynaptic protein [Parasponia andersonii]|uniref:RING-type E3 ubiquitin transferase n=1 Tax=Parasponia andersonii TaxID=3476 RepID=A0A2P5D4L7_PARAD|nr:43kDa postsynaptic protein [Parasponia andersonii]
MPSSGDGTPKRFFCDLCKCSPIVLAKSSSSPPPTCPHCILGIPMNDQEPQQEEPIIPDSSSSPNPRNLHFSFRQSESTMAELGLGLPLQFRPYPFLLRYLLLLVSHGVSPTNSNFWFDDGRALSPRLRRILDRYVLDALQHHDTTHSGPLPAPQSAINKLWTFRVPDDMSDSKWNQCAVCKDKFETWEVVTELPCKHLYHKDCILPWLEIHNTCPVCREGLTSTDGISSESGAEQRPVRMSSVFDGDPGEAGSSGGESDEENWRLIRLSLVFRFRLSEEEETVQERSDGSEGIEEAEGCT